MAKAKKSLEFEYRLTIAAHFNEERQLPTTLIAIETTKVFASFRYELSIREEVKGKELRYSILGLKAPPLSLPASGTSQFVREYENLKGKYDIIVESLDHTLNAFTVSITKKHIKVLKSPKSQIIQLVVA